MNKKDMVHRRSGRLPGKRRAAVFLLLMVFVCAGPAGCILRPADPVLEEYSAAPQEGAEEQGRTEAEEPAAAEEELPAQNLDSEAAGEALQAQGVKPGVADRALPTRGTDPGERGNTLSEQAGDLGTAEEPGGQVTVHVCGAVRREGVYTLPAESRIEDAVLAAGGFSGEADTTWLNLARRLEDAVQIRVPTKEEAELLRGGQVPEAFCGTGVGQTGEKEPAGSGEPEKGSPAESSPSGEGRININTASREELMKIPGIGEAKAQRILDYREANGGFDSIEDLMRVPGIKKASFEKMRAFITT